MTRPGGVWRNWGRTEAVRPQRVEFPRSVAAVQRAVASAARVGMPVKAVGAGHSFTGIAVASGLLLDLSDLTGVVGVDRGAARVTLRAGTRLHEIPRLLAPYGLAMENLGDIDRQTIAGAISTGTHGTGSRFGGLSTRITGATLVTASGDLLVVDQDTDSEMLPAVALGLGALGVLVEVTLQCVPAFLLHALDRPEPLEDLLGALQDRAEAADHFEFYWFPHTDRALTKTNTRLPESAVRRPLPVVGKWLDESLLSNGLYRAVCATAAIIPAVTPRFSRWAVTLTGDREYTDRSADVFTQRRTVRFVEMEYAVPAHAVRDAFDAIRAVVDERGWRISFPVEVRFAAADDLWLSTAQGRATGYIAVHRYHREDPAEYFDAVEEIMLSYGGRPHWGKLHSLDARGLRERYPHFDDFTALRERLDPDRVFGNPYLARVLGG